MKIKYKRLKNFQGSNKHLHYEATLPNKTKIIVTSNEDIYGDKWYLTNGGGNAKLYPSAEAAAEAYLKYGKTAILKGSPTTTG